MIFSVKKININIVLLFSDYLLHNGLSYSSNNSLFLKFAIIGKTIIVYFKVLAKALSILLHRTIYCNYNRDNKIKFNWLIK